MNLYGYANGDPVNYADPFGLYADRQNDDLGDDPKIASTTVDVGSGGSAITVTNEYEPLTADQAKTVNDANVVASKYNDALAGLAVALILNRSPIGSDAAAVVGFGVAVTGASATDYTPLVGDKISVTTTAAYGSTASTSRSVVTRADGTQQTFGRAVWTP